ncbi:B12-binding domain-containing radical SAM protein [Candidatus Margulisiibacteriota bacterium]
MKVLLVNPSTKNIYKKVKAPYPPLGLLYIASCLEKSGYLVDFIDWDHDINKLDDFIRLLKRSDYLFAGLTAVTPTIEHATDIAKLIKSAQDIPVVIGGIHATCNPQETLKNPCFDICILGEGEETIVELADHFSKRDYQEISNISGLAYMHNNSLISTAPRKHLLNLDLLPKPAFHLVNNISRYINPVTSKRTFPMMTTRGCPYSCTFCAANNIHGRATRSRTIKNILEEIKWLINDHQASAIHFLDDNFISSKQRFLSFYNAIIKENINIAFEFANGIRLDSVDQEILGKMKAMGFNSVGFGLESIDKKTLKEIKKGLYLDRSEIKKLVETAKKQGLETWLFFMLGFPNDSEQTMLDMIDFSIKTDPHYIKFEILKPFPGTEIHEQMHSAGLIDNYDYNKYGVHHYVVHHSKYLGPKNIMCWQKRSYRAFYLRPIKLWHIFLTHLKILDIKGLFNKLLFGLSIMFSKDQQY